MKKIFSFLLALIIITGLCACGNSSNDNAAEESRQKEIEKGREAVEAAGEVSDSLNRLQDLAKQYENSR